MRYGVIRISPGLPPTDEQRRRIEAAGCDVYLEERTHAVSGQGLLLPLLGRLKSGDELIVHGLEALEASVGEMARMFRSFHLGGVTLRIVGNDPPVSLAPGGPLHPALDLLADYEGHHPTRPATRRRSRSNMPRLSPYQLRFARDMQRRGYPMREIGLLFQLSPNEVAGALGRDAPADPGDHPTSEDRNDLNLD